MAITGNPAYYRRFGFVSGNSVGIFYADLPRDEEAPFFMVKELRPGFLYGVTGSCRESEGYSADSREVDTFDSTFSPKEKRKLPCQLFD